MLSTHLEIHVSVEQNSIQIFLKVHMAHAVVYHLHA